MNSAIGDDLLDVDWRREPVDGNVARIDDTDSVSTDEPNSSISGLRGLGVEKRPYREARHPVRSIENRHRDRPLGIACPSIQLRSSDAHQAARQVYPHRMFIVFHHPVNGIAR